MRQTASLLAAGLLFLGSLLTAVFAGELLGPDGGAVLRVAALLLMVFSLIPLVAGTLLWYRDHIYDTPWTEEEKKEPMDHDGPQ